MSRGHHHGFPAWAGVKVALALWSVVFNGTTTKIGAGTHATVTNLHDGALTAEGWFLAETLPAAQMHFISKGVLGGNNGWYLYYQNNLMVAGVECDTTDATAVYSITITDGLWHHVAMTWDDAGDRKVRIYIDRSLVGTSGAGVGVVASDAAVTLSIGCYGNFDRFFDGNVGWCRISDVVRAITTETYTRAVPPSVDANTVRLFKMDEGDGTVIGDSSINDQDATLTSGAWLRDGYG